jgi:sterol desaturase/sphingolipid hydroxylase (fatty acid hydroxylase superfamily)
MLIPLVVIGAGLLMILFEVTRPGRSWPKVAGWWARVALLNTVQAAVILASGAVWDKWMFRHRLFNADLLGVAGGAATGYFVLTFVYYWWHRWRHESQFLWRWFHQVHHSPQRIEVITSFYKHPFELLADGLLSSIVLYFGVGVGPAAATGAILMSGLAELVYHWNVNTPYWLGFLFQRPESHCIHHQQGVHWYNFSDLPLWDMLFGTFRNPREFQAACGLGPANEHRLILMLAGIDLRGAGWRG